MSRLIGGWVDEMAHWQRELVHPVSHPLTRAVVREVISAHEARRVPSYVVMVGPGLAQAEVPACLAGPAYPLVCPRSSIIDL